MLTQAGFMISIALAIGLDDERHEPDGDGRGVLRHPDRRGGIDLEPFIHALQVAFAVGFVFSMIGAVVSSMRGASDVQEELGQPVAACRSTGRPAARRPPTVSRATARSGRMRPDRYFSPVWSSTACARGDGP